MTPEQQAVISDFNETFGYTFDLRERKDAHTLRVMGDLARLRGRPDIAGRIAGLAEEMPVAEFRRLIGLAQNETEARRVTLWHQEHLVGTWAEIAEALSFAREREMHFAGGAEGVRGAGALVEPEVGA
jgi:hypothetical protein